MLIPGRHYGRHYAFIDSRGRLTPNKTHRLRLKSPAPVTDAAHSRSPRQGSDQQGAILDEGSLGVNMSAPGVRREHHARGGNFGAAGECRCEKQTKSRDFLALIVISREELDLPWRWVCR